MNRRFLDDSLCSIVTLFAWFVVAPALAFFVLWPVIAVVFAIAVNFLSPRPAVHAPASQQADKQKTDDMAWEPRLEPAKKLAAKWRGLRASEGPDKKFYYRLVPFGETPQQTRQEDERFWDSVKQTKDEPEKWAPPAGWTIEMPSPGGPVKHPGADAASPANPR